MVGVRGLNPVRIIRHTIRNGAAIFGGGGRRLLLPVRIFADRLAVLDPGSGSRVGRSDLFRSLTSAPAVLMGTWILIAGGLLYLDFSPGGPSIVWDLLFLLWSLPIVAFFALVGFIFYRTGSK